MANDAQMAPHLMLAQFLADVTGNPPEAFRDATVVYQLDNDQVGALSYACCNDHSIRLLAYGITVMIDDPQPDRAPCSPS